MIWRDLYADAIASLKKRIWDAVRLGASGTPYHKELLKELEDYTTGLRLVEEELGI